MRFFIFSFLAALATVSSIDLTQPVKIKADFGPADTNNNSKRFDAWCGERGDNCTVEFAADRIIINGTNSVKFNKIKSFTYEEIASTCSTGQIFFCQKNQYEFLISYARKDQSKGEGLILFGKEKDAMNFMKIIENVAVREYIVDPRCEIPGQAYYKGDCMDKTHVNNLKANDIKQSRQNFADNLMQFR